MDDRASGAAALLTALNTAATAFRKFGSERLLEHQAVRWEPHVGSGFSEPPGASVGVMFQLNDELQRSGSLEVVIRVRGGQFEVSGDAIVDDPKPTRLGGGDQRSLRELPQIRTASLDDCITALADYTSELCSYVSVLDELGVPRTDQPD